MLWRAAAPAVLSVLLAVSGAAGAVAVGPGENDPRGHILDYEWTLFKRFELEETLIPNKYKELMGIALHSETKCHYCTLCHTEAAKLFGATDEEIQEAAHYAKYSLGWSAYVNGMQVDFDQFKDELGKIGQYLAAKAEPLRQVG